MAKKKPHTAGVAKLRKVTVKKPPILFDKTQEIVRQLEKRLSRTFVAYWTSTSGSVCQNDVVGFNEILQKIGSQKEIALFIKSSGGSGRAALRLVHLLRQFSPRLTALIPLECASAATMLALGADEIRMGSIAYLTAVDTSITHDLSPIDKNNARVSVSQDELSRILRAWKAVGRKPDSNPYQALFQHVHPLVIGAVDRASSLSIKLCNEILSYHMKDAKKAARISSRLNSDYPSHGYPITIREARQIGLKVRPLEREVNQLLIDLNELYSEMGQEALTDYDERNYHDNEIINIIEGKDVMVYYQVDKDSHYRTEERRWVAMNDNSGWRKRERSGKKVTSSIFHIR